MGNLVLTLEKFVAQFSTPKMYGVIDFNHLSPELTTALEGAGVSLGELRKHAGTDGQMKGTEFEKLFRFLIRFNPKPIGFKLDLGTAEEPSTAGVLNEEFKQEVARNLPLPQYTKPGTKPAALQPQLTIATNALVVPAEDRKPKVSMSVTGLDQFKYAEEEGLDGNTACFRAAQAQTNRYNTNTHGAKAPALNGWDQAIQMAYAEDENGRLAVNATQAELGREYIDKCLDAGYPVLVGASYADYSYNHDKMTDHFVTIYLRDYDSAGQLFYGFKDPGDGGRNGRFYVDKDTGKLFKEGDQKTTYVRSADYEVSHVRTYKGLELD